MNGSRFDHLTRAFLASLADAAPRSRRSLAGALGALGWLGPAETEAKRRRKKKRKKKKPPCRGKPNDAPCKGDGRCLNGTCNPRPRCVGYLGACTGPGDCCSGDCDAPVACLRSTFGQRCHVDADCDRGQCVGYRCTYSPCARDADYCTEGNAAKCGADGFCLRPRGGGKSRCGFHPGFYCDCASDSYCAERLGPGAFCARISSPNCICNFPGATTFCVLPR